MKVLDGSTGEGGGQILRTALFLSTLLDEPVRVERIRLGRPKPGLKPQHEGILRMLSEICGSSAVGASVGSTTIEFTPGRPRAGTYRFDVGTAGCLALFLQTMLPVAILSSGRLELEMIGGTDVRGGPTIEWLRNVYVPRVAPLCRSLELKLEHHGFEPAGGGLVRLTVDPEPKARRSDTLRELVRDRLGQDHLKRHPLRAFEGVSVAHAMLREPKVAERQTGGAAEAFAERNLPAPKTENRYVVAPSPGTSVTLWVDDTSGLRLGSDSLGRRGLPAEDVGRRAATQLLEDWDSGATADRHLADHLVPWIALGMGAVRVPQITGHLETNVWTCQQFLGSDAVRLDGSVLRHG
jgi:RNA 3'-phosphate cyclase